VKLAAVIVSSALLMVGCGDSGRPGLLSDAENDTSGQTPLISTTSGSGSDSSGTATGDCATKSWFGDFVAHSQADVKKLFGYASVVGNIRVEPATSGGDIDVSSLRDLRCLETVYGTITIEGTSSLYDLTGFEKLRQVQSLDVSSNPGMGTLAGPRQLSVSSALRVSANGGLTSLTSGIVAATALIIEDNPQLSQCIATALAQTLHTSCSCDGNLESTTCN
jgi:hypothetical protein